MKKLYFVVLLLIASRSFGQELPAVAHEVGTQLQQQVDAPVMKSNMFQETDDEEIEQKGCCSWHGGVCGCSGGRVVCCDGEFSPSCTCQREDKQEKGP